MANIDDIKKQPAQMRPQRYENHAGRNTMPQLPSGQHVSISLDRALNGAGNGNFAIALMVEPGVTTPSDIGDLIDILYYRPAAPRPPKKTPAPASLTYLAYASPISTRKSANGRRQTKRHFMPGIDDHARRNGCGNSLRNW